MSKVTRARACSPQRIRDWIAEGYEWETTDVTAACEVWWKAWCGLLPRLRAETDTMLAADDACPSMYSIFNWCQSLQTALWNGGLRDPRWFPLGERYCREWVGQFKAESSDMKVSFLGSWADFSFKIGQVEQARIILEQALADWPNDAFCYVALADAHSHLFADRQHHLPFDPEKAAQVLKLGLSRLPRPEDQRILQQRLDELKEAIPVGKKPLPPSPQ